MYLIYHQSYGVVGAGKGDPCASVKRDTFVNNFICTKNMSFYIYRLIIAVQCPTHSLSVCLLNTHITYYIISIIKLRLTSK